VAVTELPHRGILTEWVLIGPFAGEALAAPKANGVTRSGFDTDYLAAIGGEAAAEIDLRTRAPCGSARDASLVAAVRATPLKGGHILHRPFDLAVGYAFCHLESKREHEACLLFGSDGSPKVWVNGQLVLRAWKDRHKTIAHEYVVPIRLKKGRNRVLVKLDNARGWWGFQSEVFLAGDLRLRTSLRELLDDFRAGVGVLRERMRAASADLSFLHERWHAPYRGMVTWLDRWMAEAPAKPTGRDLSHWAYAAALVETMEQRRNFIELNPGCRVPIAFEGVEKGGTKHTGHFTASFPADYAAAKGGFALVVRLHGAGGIRWGLTYLDSLRTSPRDAPAARQEPPFVELSPQRPKPWDVDDYVDVLLDRALAMFHVDDDRVCVMGGSMGGFGTWHIAMTSPERLAAIVPYAAYYNPLTAERLKHLPVWVFHGDKDPAFPAYLAELMVSALRRAGADVRYNCYAEAGHGVEGKMPWEELHRWLLAARRRKVKHPPNPLDALGLAEGVGPVAIETVGPRKALRARLKPADASLRSMYNGFKKATTDLYRPYRASGRLAETFVEMSLAVAGDETSGGVYDLVLPLHEQADPKRIDAEVHDVPAMRVASFHYSGPADGIDAAVERVTKQLRSEGHRPTGKRWDVIVMHGFGPSDTIRRIRLVLE
jgi:dienelactone hydrolase